MAEEKNFEGVMRFAKRIDKMLFIGDTPPPDVRRPDGDRFIDRITGRIYEASQGKWVFLDFCREPWPE